MKDQPKKGKKKAKVALKDLDVGKVKGGMVEEDPKGGIIDDNRLAHKGPMVPLGDKLGGRFHKY